MPSKLEELPAFSFSRLLHQLNALPRDAQGVVALVQALEDGYPALSNSFIVQQLKHFGFGLAAQGVVNASPGCQFSSPSQKWF
jgi:hypothetical protein